MKMNGKFFLLIIVPFLLLVVGCDRVVNESQGDEMARLDAWLKVNNITTPPNPSGLYYINKQEGTGASPVDSNWVIFSYVLRSLDDVVFETTFKDTAKLYDIYGIYQTTTHYVPSFMQFFSKSTVSLALAEGLSLMKEGGKARLIAPSRLAGNSSTTMIYDIELLQVITDPKAYEESLIADYRFANPSFISISDSIYYMKTADGTRACLVDSLVEVYYTGKFLDGFVFDTNIDSIAKQNDIYTYTALTSGKYDVLSFRIGSNAVKTGFEMAIKQMMEGEKGIVIVPSPCAYGVSGDNSGATKIPPYTPLIFELYLKKVTSKKNPISS